MSEDKERLNSKFVIGQILAELGMVFIIDSVEIKDGVYIVEASQLGLTRSFIYKTVRRLRAIYDWITSRRISRLVKQTKQGKL